MDTFANFFIQAISSRSEDFKKKIVCSTVEVDRSMQFLLVMCVRDRTSKETAQQNLTGEEKCSHRLNIITDGEVNCSSAFQPTALPHAIPYLFCVLL